MKIPLRTIVGPPIRHNYRTMCSYPLLNLSSIYAGLLGIFGMMADETPDTESCDPDELSKEGIEAYLMRDYNTAVTALSQASELLVKKHGERHDSLGDVYLFYGRALLQLLRNESEPLADAVLKNLYEVSDDEGDIEESDDNSEQEADSNQANGNGDRKVSEEVDNQTSEANSNEALANGTGDHAEKEEDEVEALPTANEDEAGPSTSKPPEVEDDPRDLLVAWKVLKLAKLIFENRGDSGKKQLAETLVVLGEVSLETGNFESAIGDIHSGLELQKAIFEPNSRQLAETHYKLGVALSANSQIDEAIGSFNDSLTTLQNQIMALQACASDDSAAEIAELETLVLDLNEKIPGMNNLKEEALKEMFETPDNSVSSSSENQAVKLKRKSEDETDIEPATKKFCK